MPNYFSTTEHTKISEMNHQYHETQFSFVILLILEILREKPTLPTNTISPKFEDNLVLQSHQN
jgi:hypothetical protein